MYTHTHIVGAASPRPTGRSGRAAAGPRQIQILSQQSIFNKSTNFTSDSQIRTPPTIPVNHYLGSRSQQSRTEVTI